MCVGTNSRTVPSLLRQWPSDWQRSSATREPQEGLRGLTSARTSRSRATASTRRGPVRREAAPPAVRSRVWRRRQEGARTRRTRDTHHRALAMGLSPALLAVVVRRQTRPSYTVARRCSIRAALLTRRARRHRAGQRAKGVARRTALRRFRARAAARHGGGGSKVPPRRCRRPGGAAIAAVGPPLSPAAVMVGAGPSGRHVHRARRRR